MEQLKSLPDNPSRIFKIYENPCQKPLLVQLYKDRNETGDVKFIVDSEEILAHRCVLAALSPKYKTQFYGSWLDSGDIKVDDVSAPAFKEFLQFFYTENVKLTIDNIEDVFSLAQQSLVKSLIALCAQFLMDTVEWGGICTYLRLASLYNLEKLQVKCDNLISVNIQKIFQSPDFLECGRKTLIYILKSDALNCKETEVYEASMKWAQTKCRRECVNDTDATNLRAVLGDALFAIRFGLMTFEELTSIDRQHPDLFTKTELSELLQKISKFNETKSNIFDNNPRIPQIPPIKYPFANSYSICNITEGPARWFTPSEAIDVISFKCNREIDLNGFVTCAGPRGDLLININNGTEFKAYPTKTGPLSSKHLLITFDKPVRLRPNPKNWFQIHLIVPECVAQIGFNTLNKTNKNDVIFTFKPLDSKITTICQLLFNAHINLH